MLDHNRLNYLRGLARQRRKLLDRKLGKFAAKPGQPEPEVVAALAKLLRARAYAAETEQLLTKLDRSADN